MTVPSKDQVSSAEYISSTEASGGLRNHYTMSLKPLSIWGSVTNPGTISLATNYPYGNRTGSNRPYTTKMPDSSILFSSNSTTSGIGGNHYQVSPTVYFPSYLDNTTLTVTKVVPAIPYYTPSPMPNPTSSPVFTPDTLGHAYGGGWSCVPQRYEPLQAGQGFQNPSIIGTSVGSAIPYMPTGNMTAPMVPRVPIVQARYHNGVAFLGYSSALLAIALISISTLL